MGEIIGLLSGKGGTGKTSVCAGLAIALAAEGKKVLCIDCDVGLRNLDISLGMAEQGALSFLDVSEGGYSVDGAAKNTDFPSLYLLTAPVDCPMEQIDTDHFTSMLQLLRAQFDYIFLDAPAGVDAGFRLVSAPADTLFVVTGPGPAAIRDAARVGELLELAGKHDVRLIVNRVDKSLLSAIRLTVDDVMDSTGIPLLGIVPEDTRVTLAAAFGCPLLRYARRSDASRALYRISRRMQGYREPIPMR